MILSTWHNPDISEKQEPQLRKCLYEELLIRNMCRYFLNDHGVWGNKIIVYRFHPWQMILGCRRNQVRQSMSGNPLSNFPLWPLCCLVLWTKLYSSKRREPQLITNILLNNYNTLLLFGTLSNACACIAQVHSKFTTFWHPEYRIFRLRMPLSLYLSPSLPRFLPLPLSLLFPLLHLPPLLPCSSPFCFYLNEYTEW